MLAIILACLGEVIFEIIIAIRKAKAALRDFESVKAASFRIGRHLGTKQSANAPRVKIGQQLGQRFGRGEPLNSFQVTGNRFEAQFLQPVGIHARSEEIAHLARGRLGRRLGIGGAGLKDLPDQLPVALLQFLEAAPT